MVVHVRVCEMTWWTAVDILPICGSGSVLLQSPVEIEARDWLGQARSFLCLTELRLSIQGGASALWTQSDPSSWTQHPNRHLHLHKRPSRSGDADAWGQNLNSFSFWREFLDFECLSSFSENEQKPADVKRAASVCLKRGSEKNEEDKHLKRSFVWNLQRGSSTPDPSLQVGSGDDTLKSSGWEI